MCFPLIESDALQQFAAAFANAYEAGWDEGYRRGLEDSGGI